MKIKLLISFLLALGLSWICPEADLFGLVEKAILNLVAIFVGLAIAIVGVFLGSVNNLYLSIYKIHKSQNGNDEVLTNEEIIKIVQGLNSVVKELKENCIFALICFGVIILLFIWKFIDIPFLIWFIEGKVTKLFFINTIIYFGTALEFVAIYDCVIATFKITESLSLIKVK